MQKFSLLFAFVLAATQLVGCRVAPSKPTEQDTIAIYQTVIRRLCQTDDTFGGMLEKRTLYIIRATNDAAGDPSIQQSNSVVLSETVQQGVTDALADLPVTIMWVDRFDQVSIDADTGFVSDKGVIITLGNIKYENSDKALVPASIYVAFLAAGGRTYIVEKKDGVWTITGTTGVEWIS
jgi:hypothetical protein